MTRRLPFAFSGTVWRRLLTSDPAKSIGVARQDVMFALLLYLILMVVLYTSPVILLALIFRRCIHPWLASSLLALAFAVAIGVTLWRLDWFDVWRQRAPTVPALLTAYGTQLAIFAILGWFVGALIARPANAKGR